MPLTREQEAQRRKAGLCLSCPCPVALHADEKRKGQAYPYCQKHLLLRREADRRRNPRAALVQRHAERRAAGRCQVCGQPALVHLSGKLEGRAYPWCEKHLLLRREVDRRRWARRKAHH